MKTQHIELQDQQKTKKETYLKKNRERNKKIQSKPKLASDLERVLHKPRKTAYKIFTLIGATQTAKGLYNWQNNLQN